MALKLDDLQKKKDSNQILDLSRIKIKSVEDFNKYFDKVPEYKIRPEKVRYEDIKVRDTDFSFHFSKKESRILNKGRFAYGDPVPVSMRSVRLEDLAGVDINWRMLTMARPKNRLEEDIFSRLVDLGKLRLSTVQNEAKKLASALSSNPGSSGAVMGIIVSKNKRGVTETRMKVCKECGEELCSGIWCKEFPYESYTRMVLDNDEAEDQERKEDETNQNRRGSKMKPKGTKLKSKLKRRRRKRKKRTGASKDNDSSGSD